MAHLCKCIICGEQFDIDKEQAVCKSNKRYAHQACYPEGELVPMDKHERQEWRNKKKQVERSENLMLTQEDKLRNDKQDLMDYIGDLYGSAANYQKISKQLKNYIDKDGYTYSGIAKCLHYFYEIQHHSIEDSNGGIGIVGFIYSDVKKYYYQLYQVQAKNAGKDAKQMFANKIYVSIRSPKAKVYRRLFNM